MRKLSALALIPLGIVGTALPTVAHAALYITIVQGLGGQPQYEKEFADTRAKVEAASRTMTEEDKVFSFATDAATRDALLKHFSDLNKKMKADDRAAIYLIGHGSFDGETYKFNIPGPDLSASDFKEVLDSLPGKNHLIVNTSSTSGAMLEALVGRGENATNDKYIVMSATRNGNERNATHFGRFFAEALTTAAADLNKNNSVSIQEAFDYASNSVASFFQEDGKLATEHPQLRGEGTAQFNLSRLNALELERELANADEGLAALLQRRQEIDAQIEELQLNRQQMSNSDYLARFQSLVLQSAEISEQIDAAQKGNGSDSQRFTPEIPQVQRAPNGGGNGL